MLSVYQQTDLGRAVFAVLPRWRRWLVALADGKRSAAQIAWLLHWRVQAMEQELDALVARGLLQPVFVGGVSYGR